MTHETLTPRATITAPPMTPEAFANWGLEEIAYVKRTNLGGTWVYTVHAANGEQVAVAPAREVAAALIVQNDLVPVDVH